MKKTLTWIVFIGSVVVVGLLVRQLIADYYAFQEITPVEVYPDEQKINVEVTPVEEWPTIVGQDKGK